MSFFFLSFLVFFPWIAFSRRFRGFFLLFTQITRVPFSLHADYADYADLFFQTDGHGLQQILLFYADFADGD